MSVYLYLHYVWSLSIFEINNIAKLLIICFHPNNVNLNFFFSIEISFNTSSYPCVISIVVVIIIYCNYIDIFCIYCIHLYVFIMNFFMYLQLFTWAERYIWEYLAVNLENIM